MTKEKQFDSFDDLHAVFGELDGNIKRISEAFDVDIITADGAVRIIGKEDAVEGASEAFDLI